MSGSIDRRTLLIDALQKLGLRAWNAEASHAVAGLCAIDLICGPWEVNVVRQGRIDPERDGDEMSDHAGYWVEV